MKHLAAILSSLVAFSCLADRLGEVAEPGLHWGTGSAAETAMKAWQTGHPGPCAGACLSATVRNCAWEQACEEADFVACGPMLLTCDEAEDAGASSQGDYAGVTRCYVSCEAGRLR